MKFDFSIIIPVYNRPEEIIELLKSLEQQCYKDFEVLVIEDGSTLKCDRGVKKYSGSLNLKYYQKENTGPGNTRNYGIKKSIGNYYIFLDSDCILPTDYLKNVATYLKDNKVDCFGGSDKNHYSFTDLQKAITYSMTAFCTTGGIRGGKKKIEKFYPRSFNMGFSKEVFQATGGFSNMRFGEDIDMSIRIIQKGFYTDFLPDAFVYHKRRTTLKKFFKQIVNSGSARIQLYKKHPQSLKLVHFLPLFFTIGALLSIFISLWYHLYMMIPLISYTLIVFIESTIKNKNFRVGILAILTTYTQLVAYTLGFSYAYIRINILKKENTNLFINHFYK